MSAGGERTSQRARRLARAALLAPKTLEARLGSITGGDPLSLYPLGAARARERCLLLDPDRVFDESIFNVVALSVLLEERDDFDAWLLERVDEALDNLVRRDSEALRRGVLDDEEVRESGEYLAGCLGLSAGEGLVAATRFNRLPFRTRRTFFALLVEQLPLEDCLRVGLGPRDELRERALRAVEAILGPRPESARGTASVAAGEPSPSKEPAP